jgi:ABC-2 type transport system permease protein
VTTRLAALYRLMLRIQLTRGRLLALAALGAVGVVVGFAIGRAEVVEPLTAGTRFINVFGLSLLVPVATLVFASAALGDPTEDGTLVYLWLRPVPRSHVVGAAVAAAFSVTWPVVVVPLVLSAALTGAGTDLVVGTVAGATAGMVAYSAIFVALGLRVKRALVWGLLYIFIWEGFVATANTTAARLAIRSYARSILSDATGVTLRLADFTLASSWLVPVAVAVVAAAYATRRLRRMDIA